MTNDDIKAIALANGFTLREQPDGSMDLNPYVYGFARAMFEQGRGISAQADANVAAMYDAMQEAIRATSLNQYPRRCCGYGFWYGWIR